ncbi:sn-glycerol-3-phosphate ABC transporter ATP-binding protein UgpC [Shimia sp. R10_1]|uniref:ABC transporter ATP-binding protein n=1 Tax=Shimia sp. R10_1 TaxID=2821095 RepID=UPI001ADA98B0|nr:sn-glycerol-3-phosphate ABC transporter ATP-binding protein UgpC [Shimia sp. R10_1]MBO9475287.1 sn-glycerol-3-phosphate ABC transporter ATP-binding protein UgpC [Shimia sp. R10_1]
MSAITLRNVIKRYGAVEVVHGIDLDVEEGEFVVLLGPSGCGKTTTLRMVAGLEDVSDGDLSIGGARVNEVAPKDRGVAMVFQNYALYPHMTVRQNMEFSLKPLSLPADEVARRVDEVASTLGLAELLSRRPAQLSGGQRQRVAMGRAMVRTPDVFLFDEPLSNLDAKLRTQVRLEIAKLHNRLGTTVLYVTHDQVEAMTLADKIVIMRDGHIEQVGTPEQVYSQPNNTFVATFIGSPPMNMIPARVRQGRLEADGLLLSVPDRFKGVLAEDQAVTIGIRPNGLSLAKDVDHNTAPARVEVTEYLGNEALLDLRAGPHELIAEVPALGRPAPGAEVTVHFDPDALHLFDTASGDSLSL